MTWLSIGHASLTTNFELTVGDAWMRHELVRNYLKPKIKGALSVGCHFAVIIAYLLTTEGACGLSGLLFVKELSRRCLLNLTR